MIAAILIAIWAALKANATGRNSFIWSLAAVAITVVSQFLVALICTGIFGSSLSPDSYIVITVISALLGIVAAVLVIGMLLPEDQTSLRLAKYHDKRQRKVLRSCCWTCRDFGPVSWVDLTKGRCRKQGCKSFAYNICDSYCRRDVTEQTMSSEG